MKIIIILFAFLLSVFTIKAQDQPFKLYDPAADAEKQISDAVSEASTSGKHIFVQLGGNWCKWCKLFYQFSTTNAKVDSTIKTDFVVVHLNYSKENKNEALLKKYEFPQRFGFPVFLILDEKGNRLHTQNTAYLEEGEGYSEKKVVEFLNHWKREALLEKNY